VDSFVSQNGYNQGRRKLLEMSANPEDLVNVLADQHLEILQFANASGALTAAGKGAISALPNKEEVYNLIENQTKVLD
jgi:fructokinase